jgi:hypothetical protein
MYHKVTKWAFTMVHPYGTTTPLQRATKIAIADALLQAQQVAA